MSAPLPPPTPPPAATDNGNERRDANDNKDAARLIIADVDVGIDDAWALFMLLKAETPAHPVDHRLLAITCVAGNTGVDNVAVNVARVLQTAERKDIPVYKGCVAGLIEDVSANGPPYHGHDGLGDVPFDRTTLDLSPIRTTEHAINALHRLVSAHPQRVTLVCTGPLTNIALAIRMFGAAGFVQLVRDIHIMGGNYHGVGNSSARVCAEYNFYADPEAAWIVLDAFAAAGKPVHILPWEACTAKTLKIPMSWRFEVLGKVQHPVLDFVNPIEEALFGSSEEPTYGLCDALLVGALLFPRKLVKRVKRRACTVELQGRHTRGQVVVDHVSGAGKTGNVRMVELLEAEACKEVLLWVVDAVAEGWARV